MSVATANRAGRQRRKNAGRDILILAFFPVDRGNPAFLLKAGDPGRAWCQMPCAEVAGIVFVMLC